MKLKDRLISTSRFSLPFLEKKVEELFCDASFHLEYVFYYFFNILVLPNAIIVHSSGTLCQIDCKVGMKH